MATITTLAKPPTARAGTCRRSGRGWGMPTRGEADSSVIARASCCPSLRGARAAFRNLEADRVDWRQAGHRFLKDHGYVPATDPPQCVAVRTAAAQCPPVWLPADVQQDLRSRCHTSRRIDQPHHGARRNALAAAALADDAKRLAGQQIEAHAVYCLENPFVKVESRCAGSVWRTRAAAMA